MINLEAYREIVKKCSHCGYCQATCPVYQADLLESHVAKNRLNLINEVMILQTMPLTPRFREILDRCLVCTNCTQTCSSRVPVDEVIIAARAELEKKGVAGLKKMVVGKILTQRGLTGFLARAGSLAQKVGIGTGEMPSLAPKPFQELVPDKMIPLGAKRGRVAYFVGCGTNYLYPDTGLAVARVLSHNGWEVTIPGGQVCCGLPVMSEGDLSSAEEMARTNIDVLAGLDVDFIITDCSSCGMMMKEKWAKLLPEDDPRQEKLSALLGRVYEVTDFLQQQGLKAAPGDLSVNYTYHVPCHRGWSGTMKEAPRKVLAGINGASLREMEEPERCCGAGGAFFMQHRELSGNIRARRIEDIRETGADTVVTQCPVCRFYLSAGLKEVNVLHPVGLLARAYGFQ